MMSPDGENALTNNIYPLTVKFVHAALGVCATLDVQGGSLVVEAGVRPGSYVLSRSCTLHGGFALCYWFHPSAHAGDWVFSIGGYHPAFRVPSHWPVPERAGISWCIGTALHVGGSGFFAVTPRTVMGGGRIDANFHAGPVYADFAAWASFLINYRPFFFVAEMGVSVRVGAKFHILFIKINIHVTVGARLMLRGPPFGGSARIDFKVIHVSVDFGSTAAAPAALSLSQFLALVKRPGNGSPSSPDQIVVSLSQGAAAASVAKYSQPEGEVWKVRSDGTLRFRVESKVPVGEATLREKGPGFSRSTTQRASTQAPAIYARPTRSQTALMSTLVVSVSRSGGAATRAGVTESGWRTQVITKRLPRALWGKCKSIPPPPELQRCPRFARSLLTQHNGTRRFDQRGPNLVQRRQKQHHFGPLGEQGRGQYHRARCRLRVCPTTAFTPYC